MNLIDFFLNNKFTVKEDGGIETNSTIGGSIRDLKKYFKTEDILEMAKEYKGNHYKFIVNLAIENNKLDLVFDLALLNQDSKLSKQIYAKIQEAKLLQPKVEEVKVEKTKIEQPELKQFEIKHYKIERPKIEEIESEMNSSMEELFREYKKFKKDFDNFKFHDEKINMLDEINLSNNDPLMNIMNIFFPFGYGMEFFHDDDEEDKKK